MFEMFEMFKDILGSKVKGRKIEDASQKNKRQIVVQTDYGHITIIDLKEVYAGSNKLGQAGLAYQDAQYEYNTIYWTYDSPEARKRYQTLKSKLLEAYNRGDAIVELYF